MSGTARLPADAEALVRLSAALAGREVEGLDRALREAKDSASPLEVEEALLQSYLFLGYPVALNGFARWRALMKPDEIGEVEKRPETDPVADDLATWAARGAEVCQTVYGGQYLALRENVRALHPDMERWMVTEGYGKVLGRPGLPLVTRELCIAALLAVLETPRQLYSHLRGALNAGADPGEVEAALEVAAPFCTSRARVAASEVWARVSGRTPVGGQ